MVLCRVCYLRFGGGGWLWFCGCGVVGLLGFVLLLFSVRRCWVVWFWGWWQVCVFVVWLFLWVIVGGVWFVYLVFGFGSLFGCVDLWYWCLLFCVGVLGRCLIVF